MSSFYFSVRENNAQINVTVTFDPPSPVQEGVTTFRCDFESECSTGKAIVIRERSFKQRTQF